MITILKAFIAVDEIKLQNVAKQLARVLQKGDCIVLTGGLGAGKTTFASGIIKELCGDLISVTSPTFTIQNSYISKDNVNLLHYDFYRIKSADEAKEVGFSDYLDDSISIIEWGEKIEDLLPSNSLLVRISIIGDKLRDIEFIGLTFWYKRIKKISMYTVSQE